MSCFVTAIFLVDPDRTAEFEAIAFANMPTVRAEQGCLRYDLHRSFDVLGQYLFYEEWESRDALNAHAVSPHMRAYRKATKDLFFGPTKINIWEKIA